MPLERDYLNFMLHATKVWTEAGNFPTDQDVLMNVAREAGEVLEEYALYAGSNVHKGPPTGNMVPVVQELADVIAAAVTAIIRLGFNPDDMLARQVEKVKSRYPDIMWDEA